MTYETTLYFGPWPCWDTWVAKCKKQCQKGGFKFCGCVWISDAKVKRTQKGILGFGGTVLHTRVAEYQCLCNWDEISAEECEVERKEYEDARVDLYIEHAKGPYGEWPRETVEVDGKRRLQRWHGHHKRDLKRGGHSTNPGNVIPLPAHIHRDVHSAYCEVYKCDGKSKYATGTKSPKMVGGTRPVVYLPGQLPYTDVPR